MRADTGNDEIRVHALALAYSTQVSAWNCESDRELSRYQMRWRYAKDHGLPSPPPPVDRPPPEMPHRLRDVYTQNLPPPTAPVASEPEGTRQASRPPPRGESSPSPSNHGDGEGAPVDPVANTPLPDGSTSPVINSPNVQTPTRHDGGDDDRECEDSPSPAALAAAARRREPPETLPSSPAPGERPLRTRPPLPNDAFRDPIRQRLNDADGQPLRRASTRATQKPTRLVSM